MVNCKARMNTAYTDYITRVQGLRKRKNTALHRRRRIPFLEFHQKARFHQG